MLLPRQRGERSYLSANRPPFTTVHLAGGLGNQLFQLAAGLSVAGNDHLALEYSLGNPRKTDSQLPAVGEVQLPERVSLMDLGLSPLRQRAISRIINSQFRATARKSETSGLRFTSIRESLVRQMIASSTVGRPAVLLSSDIGFEPRLHGMAKDSYLVGYFQSWRTLGASINRQAFRQLIFKGFNSIPNALGENSTARPPIVVHVRLGDYRYQRGFGRLTPEYFAICVSQLHTQGYDGRVWVASDEPLRARHALSKFRVFRDAHYLDHSNSPSSPLAALHHLTQGGAYVLSNSSFSWWAAYLSDAEPYHIVAPDPWFTDLATPLDLVPNTWSRMPRVGSDTTDFDN